MRVVTTAVLAAAPSLVASLAGCSGRAMLVGDSASSDRGPAPLTGSWRGTDGSLTVVVSLTQAGDSVSGTGTYTNARGTTGCGGGTLPSRGAVTLVGRVTGASFGGSMRFDNGWTPPYLGDFAGADTLQAHFMSVDRGPCQLPLVRQR